MIFTTILAVSLLPVLTVAQYGGAPPASGGTSTSAAPVAAPSAPPDTPGHMNVDVAFNETFTFHPNNFNASNGTLVTFWVPNNGLNHSITQSSFAAPCTHLAASGNTSAGFDSGLIAAEQFTINITDDTKPIWFHCKQLLHCGMGMVGAINAPTTGNNTFSAFSAAATQIGSSEVTETDNGPVTGGVNGIATAPPSATQTTSPSGSPSSSTRTAASFSAAFIVAAIVVAFV